MINTCFSSFSINLNFLKEYFAPIIPTNIPTACPNSQLDAVASKYTINNVDVDTPKMTVTTDQVTDAILASSIFKRGTKVLFQLTVQTITSNARAEISRSEIVLESSKITKPEPIKETIKRYIQNESNLEKKDP